MAPVDALPMIKISVICSSNFVKSKKEEYKNWAHTEMAKDE